MITIKTCEGVVSQYLKSFVNYTFTEFMNFLMV